MAKLSASERAQLPDSAFAHVSASGKRSLPIHDESHVRNALSRFGQVRFENDREQDLIAVVSKLTARSNNYFSLTGNEATPSGAERWIRTIPGLELRS